MAVRSSYRTARLALVALLLLLGINFLDVNKSDESASVSSSAESSLDLSLSKQFMPVAYTDANRDIFSYVRSNQESAAPANEAPVAKPARKTSQRTSYKSSANKSVTTSLKLVGMLLKRDDKLAFVIYRGKPYTLRETEILAGRYEVLAISQTALNLRNRQNNKTFVITL